MRRIGIALTCLALGLALGTCGLAQAAIHATISSATGNRATETIVVEGILSCDVQQQDPFEIEEGLKPQCSGWAELDPPWIYVNSYNERCGKPGGYLGTQLGVPFEATSYSFRVAGKVDIAREGEPTIACLREDTGGGWRIIARRFIKWQGEPPEPPEPSPPAHPRHTYWQDCGEVTAYPPISVIAHRVNCTKAKRVIRHSWVKGQSSSNGFVKVKSFTCHIRPNSHRMIECSHGSHRILGPLPG